MTFGMVGGIGFMLGIFIFFFLSMGYAVYLLIRFLRRAYLKIKHRNDYGFFRTE